MYPDACLRSDSVPRSTPTACCWPRPICSASARRPRARARASTAPGLDLGIWVIIAALVGAKLLLLIVDFDHFSSNPAELLSLVRSGGVFYGGLILAVPSRSGIRRRAGLPIWTTCDAFAPGIALGHVVGRLGCLLAGAATAGRRTCPGRSHSRTRSPPPTSARRWACPCTRRSCTRPAPSWSSCRPAPRPSAAARPFPGPDVLGIHPALRGLALRHRVLSRRSARDGRAALDVPVHLGLVPLSVVMLVWLGRARPRAQDNERRKLAACTASGDSQEHLQVEVRDEHDGQRLDQFLAPPSWRITRDRRSSG